MDWQDFQYKHIAEMIPDEDIKIIIDIIIEDYDNKGKFDLSFNHATDFLFSHVHNKDFYKEFDNLICQNKKDNPSENQEDDIGLDFWFQDDFNNDFYKSIEKENICRSILSHIEKVAIQIRKERVLFRLKNGEHVNFESCQQTSEFHDKIEFYKDGGWGIAEKDGTVIIPNHIKGQPSKQIRYIKSTLKHFFIIQDRDTELCGVISIEDSIKEVLHCIYNHIEIIEQKGNEKKNFYIKVQIGEQWGFFNEDFVLIVNIQYGSIEIRDKYIEGNRDGRQYDEEIEWGQYMSFYDGKKDLYDLYGNFILGGYDFLDIDSTGYFLFYWHSVLEEYSKAKTGLWDDEYYLTGYRRNFDDAICLILDDQFKPISGENYTLRGVLKKPLNEAYYSIPHEAFFKHETHINSNDPFKFPIFEFFGCKIKNEDEYYFYVKQIVKNADEFYFPDRYLEWYNYYSTGINMNIKKINNKGTIVKDDQIVLSSYSQERELIWRALVNEIGITESHAKIYRIGCKCGFYSSEHIHEAKYDAISLNSTDEHIYVAIVESMNKSDKLEDSNPNVFTEVGLKISFYEVLEENVLELLPDNWDAFNPTKHQWFPNNFRPIAQIAG